MARVAAVQAMALGGASLLAGRRNQTNLHALAVMNAMTMCAHQYEEYVGPGFSGQVNVRSSRATSHSTTRSTQTRRCVPIAAAQIALGATTPGMAVLPPALTPERRQRAVVRPHPERPDLETTDTQPSVKSGSTDRDHVSARFAVAHNRLFWARHPANPQPGMSANPWTC
jgi:hypothetical protein